MIIAIANSRKNSVLKNVNISWKEFLSRVSNTTRTAESVEEYKKLPKEQQDDIKDVGGFVAGFARDGRRKNGYIEYRSMLTLDMDYAKKDVWHDIIYYQNFTCCIYSTHKHSPEKPRLRLIIPLSRDVTPDEYTAISRKVASNIGIDQFDDTTYEPARLMYWPSTSSDGEFVFKSHEGVILDDWNS